MRVASHAVVALHDQDAPTGAREQRARGEAAHSRADHDGVVLASLRLGVEPHDLTPFAGGLANNIIYLCGWPPVVAVHIVFALMLIGSVRRLRKLQGSGAPAVD